MTSKARVDTLAASATMIPLPVPPRITSFSRIIRCLDPDYQERRFQRSGSMPEFGSAPAVGLSGDEPLRRNAACELRPLHGGRSCMLFASARRGSPGR
jgi:hypothetical protein